MPKALLVVYSQPAASEQDNEYNEWYDTVHIPQVLDRISGVTAAARYRLSDTQIAAADELPQRRYLTLYEIESDDLAAVRDRLVEALGDGTFDWSDALDMADLAPVPHVYELASHPAGQAK